MGDQIEHISKPELLAHIRGERGRLEAALAGLIESSGIGAWKRETILRLLGLVGKFLTFL